MCHLVYSAKLQCIERVKAESSELAPWLCSAVVELHAQLTVNAEVSGSCQFHVASFEVLSVVILSGTDFDAQLKLTVQVGMPVPLCVGHARISLCQYTGTMDICSTHWSSHASLIS